jgi:hypothetical protein
MCRVGFPAFPQLQFSASVSWLRVITGLGFRVIASLPNLNPRRILYGSTTHEDGRGDEVEKLLAAHAAVVFGGDDRIGQALSPVTGPTDARRYSRLSTASGKARLITEFTQRGNLGDEVLLPPDVGLERQAIVYSTEKAKLATARSVILIRFQEEPKYGRVEAWEDHGGSTGEQ